MRSEIQSRENIFKENVYNFQNSCFGQNIPQPSNFMNEVKEASQRTLTHILKCTTHPTSLFIIIYRKKENNCLFNKTL